MKASIYFFLALIVEGVLLILILIFLLLGVLGIFLPAVPGLFLLGIGAGIYSLLVKSGRGKVTPHVHRRVINFGDKIFKLKITQKLMGLVKTIKKRKEKKVRAEILKHGLILFGFNAVLVLAFLFGFISLTLLLMLLGWQDLMLAFVPLVVIFLFAGGSAIVWYRFGQILGSHFKKRKIINTALVVLVSVLPLLVILLLFSGLFSLAGSFIDGLLFMMFLGFLLMAVLAAVFELIVVTLGVITPVK